MLPTSEACAFVSGTWTLLFVNDKGSLIAEKLLSYLISLRTRLKVITSLSLVVIDKDYLIITNGAFFPEMYRLGSVS